MPRKDGKPTAPERKDAERIASNERFVKAATDEQLAELAATPSNQDDPVVWKLITDEQARRAAAK